MQGEKMLRNLILSLGLGSLLVGCLGELEDTAKETKAAVEDTNSQISETHSQMTETHETLEQMEVGNFFLVLSDPARDRAYRVRSAKSLFAFVAREIDQAENKAIPDKVRSSGLHSALKDGLATPFPVYELTYKPEWPNVTIIGDTKLARSLKIMNIENEDTAYLLQESVIATLNGLDYQNTQELTKDQRDTYAIIHEFMTLVAPTVMGARKIRKNEVGDVIGTVLDSTHWDHVAGQLRGLAAAFELDPQALEAMEAQIENKMSNPEEIRLQLASD